MSIAGVTGPRLRSHHPPLPPSPTPSASLPRSFGRQNAGDIKQFIHARIFGSSVFGASPAASQAGRGSSRLALSCSSPVSTSLPAPLVHRAFPRLVLSPANAPRDSQSVSGSNYSGSVRRGFATVAAASGDMGDKTRVLGLTWPSAPVLPQVDFSFSTSTFMDAECDILVVGLFDSAVKRDENGKFLEILDLALSSLDQSLGGIVTDLLLEPEFKAKPGQVSSVVRIPGFQFKRIALVGLGKRASLASPAPATWKAVGSALASVSKNLGAESAALVVLTSNELLEDEGTAEKDKKPAAEGKEETPSSRGLALGQVAQGVLLGSFQDVRFKSEDKEREKASFHVKSVDFFIPGLDADVEGALFKAVRIAAGTILARELVNAPPNVLTPETMAQVAEGLESSHSDVLKLKVLSKEDCEELGMGAYLAVAAASDNPPKFIHLTYSPPGASSEGLKKLAIIGKGLTFDSGGYNLKAGPGSLIHLMKFDMGGAAATLGAAKAVAAIQPPGVEVHFIVAACENMVSGAGLRPGDIITASNGKTIEVNNTDAEGRLTLADALVYAGKLKVHKIVDLATLTGACIVALGNDIAGLFTPSDDMAKELEEASKVSGEKLWRMPMEEPYFEGLKSSVADMVNTGPREGGSITAALFLKQYVDKDTPWAHIDMAGPVWNYKTSQGSGYAADLLYQWVEANSVTGAAL